MFSKLSKGIDSFPRWRKAGLLVFLAVVLSLGLSATWVNPAIAGKRPSSLPAGNAITDGRALLRYALPIENQAVRDLQISLEDISTQLRSNRRWSAIEGDITKASGILTNRQSKLLEGIPEAKKPQAEGIIAQMQEAIAALRQGVEAEDKQEVTQKRAQILNLVSQLEELMVEKFPYEVPSEYSHLPQLKGRATVEMETSQGSITMIVDGYSAPVTAGNFVDLVQRGFYDGLKFIRAEESYVLQAGDPPGPDQGFIDPTSGKYRNIPLEVLVRGDSKPTYGITLEDAGRYREQPVLPFSAYGTVAMARPEEDADGASSQFFFFLFEPELTPAGLNLLDGRYSVFGYVVEGKEVLEKLKAGESIISAKVIQGSQNLVPPQSA